MLSAAAKATAKTLVLNLRIPLLLLLVDSAPSLIAELREIERGFSVPAPSKRIAMGNPCDGKVKMINMAVRLILYLLSKKFIQNL
jgi:hypothetical protein